MMGTSIHYVFLGAPSHPMSCITMERLNECGFFTPANCLIITYNYHNRLARYALDRGYKVLQGKTNEEVFLLLKKVNYNFLISSGWGYKISEDILKLAKTASINSHNSFLPDYKGLAPYKHVWANVEDFSGITVHIMDENLDTGNILAQQKVRVYWWDSPKTILLRISEHAPTLIMLAIEKYNNGYRGFRGNSSKGRYFLKTSNSTFIKYLIYNLIAKKIGLKKKYTKYKSIVK